MTYHRIWVPLVPPSPNEMRRKYRDHHAYKKLREIWEQAVVISTGSAAVTQELRREANNGKKVVSIFISHERKYDPDNLYGSAKVCLDALVNVGFLKGDTEKHIELTVTQERDRDKGTTIVLENIPHL